MSVRLRRVLLLSVAFAGGLLLLFQRLDHETMLQDIRQSMGSILESGIGQTQASFSWFPVFGLKLTPVQFEIGNAMFRARSALVQVRLLPLVFGKTEIKSIRLDSPRFTLLRRPVSVPSIQHLAMLPFQRLVVIRGVLSLPDGSDLVDDISLDLRDIGPNRDMLWDFQANMKGHKIRSHGRLELRQGQMYRGFGKFGADHLPAAQLARFVPRIFRSYFSAKSYVDGSVSLNVSGRERWQLVVEAGLLRETVQLAVLRGKLEKDPSSLRWFDTYLHLEGGAVLGLDGRCQVDTCQTKLKGKKLPLEPILAAWPASFAKPEQLQGRFGVDATFEWQRNHWGARGEIDLHHPRLRYGPTLLTFPEWRLDIKDLVGDASQWRFDRASLSDPRGEEVWRLRGASKEGVVEFGLKTEGVHAGWDDLGRWLMLQWHLDPRLSGEGMFKGTIHVRHGPVFQDLRLEIDAGKMHLAYADQFDKPDKVPFRCHLQIQKKQVISVQLDDCDLGSASIRHGSGHFGENHHDIMLQDVRIDLDLLHDRDAVRLPDPVEAMRGKLQGDLEARWEEKDTASASDQIRFLAGRLDLDHFGTKTFHASGLLAADGTNLRSHRLQLKGFFGELLLAGNYALHGRNGQVDVLTGHVNWDQTAPRIFRYLPSKGALGGSLRHVGLMDSSSKAELEEGRYELKHGQLAMHGLTVRLAGGRLAVSQAILTPEDNGLHIRTRMKAEGVRPELLPRLRTRFKASLSGKLFANVWLEGLWPGDGFLGNWQGNGDVVIYNGTWQPFAENAGTKMAFRRLTGRFRLDDFGVRVQRLGFERRDTAYHGNAKIDRSGKVDGTLWDQLGHRYLLRGTWPKMQLQPLSSSSESMD